jgi:membrane protease YdiL (CAAX protease family)
VVNNSRRNGFWYLVSPAIIFLALNMLAQSVAVTFLLAGQRMPEIRSALEGQRFSFESIMNINSLVSSEDMAEATSYIAAFNPYIIVFGAIITLIYSVVAFRKGRREEVATGLFIEKKPKRWQYFYIAILAVIASLGVNLLLLMFQVAFPNLRDSSGSLQNMALAPFWFQIIGFGIIIVVAEEYIFRGLIFKRYRENNGFVRTMIITSVLFAFFQTTTIQTIYAFILGLLCAYVYEKFGSLIAPVIVHSLTSITALLLTEFGGYLWFFEAPIRVGIAVVLATVAVSTLIMKLRGIQVTINTSEGLEA